MEATPVAQRGHTRLQFLFENHPFRHEVRAAEILRLARNRALSEARCALEYAQQLELSQHRVMMRGVASTYVSVARQRNRRLVQTLRAMREVCP